jgi:RES domain-containing protein
MLEILVNLGIKPKVLPIDYVLMTIVVPDSLATESAPSDIEFGKESVFGDNWLMSRRSPALWVPSVVMPQSFNIIVNPEHPEAAALTIRDITPLRIDPRLFREQM